MRNQIELRSRPNLVLMAGLPGTGKTTLAYALGRALQWLVIDKDVYKEVLLKQEFDDECAGKTAYELSFAIARAILIRQQLSVIIDTAALHHFIFDKVKEIVCNVEGAQLKVILCVADRDLRNFRLRNRLYRPTNTLVDPATIADYLRHFEHLPEDKLTLFTNTPFEECLTRALEYVIN